MKCVIKAFVCLCILLSFIETSAQAGEGSRLLQFTLSANYRAGADNSFLRRANHLQSFSDFLDDLDLLDRAIVDMQGIETDAKDSIKGLRRTGIPHNLPSFIDRVEIVYESLFDTGGTTYLIGLKSSEIDYELGRVRVEFRQLKDALRSRSEYNYDEVLEFTDALRSLVRLRNEIQKQQVEAILVLRQFDQKVTKGPTLLYEVYWLQNLWREHRKRGAMNPRLMVDYLRQAVKDGDLFDVHYAALLYEYIGIIERLLVYVATTKEGKMEKSLAAKAQKIYYLKDRIKTDERFADLREGLENTYREFKALLRGILFMPNLSWGEFVPIEAREAILKKLVSEGFASLELLQVSKSVKIEPVISENDKEKFEEKKLAIERAVRERLEDASEADILKWKKELGISVGRKIHPNALFNGLVSRDFKRYHWEKKNQQYRGEFIDSTTGIRTEIQIRIITEGRGLRRRAKEVQVNYIETPNGEENFQGVLFSVPNQRSIGMAQVILGIKSA